MGVVSKPLNAIPSRTKIEDKRACFSSTQSIPTTIFCPKCEVIVNVGLGER